MTRLIELVMLLNIYGFVVRRRVRTHVSFHCPPIDLVP
jgi:hypothetical protein